MAHGLFVLIGDRTASDIGWKWMWPVPLVVVGLLFVISAIRRVIAQSEVAELDSERVDAEIVGQDEDEG